MSNYTSEEELPLDLHPSRYGFASIAELALKKFSYLQCDMLSKFRNSLRFAMILALT